MAVSNLLFRRSVVGCVVVIACNAVSRVVTTSRNIPRRSTLIVLRGSEELGRIVAGTRKSDIKTLMDLGLNRGS